MPKIPTPAKENSRAWAWALQQNIMALSFEHTQQVHLLYVYILHPWNLYLQIKILYNN